MSTPMFNGAAPAKEFVLDMRRYPEAQKWVSQLVQDLG